MSFNDDAQIMLLSSFGASKDGKAYTVKPVGGGAPLYVTRGSNLTATRVDSNGLIEKGRENLLLQSNQFDTTWVNYLIATPTSGQSGYDGNNDAWLVQCINTSNFAGVSQAVSSSGVNVLSFYAKSGNVDYVGAHINAGTQGNINFELTGSGSVGSVWNTGLFGEIKRVGITDWYRCSFVFNGNLSNVRIGPRSSISSFNSAIGDNVIIQDAQLEQGLVATEYIESGASTGLGGILEDMPRLDYSGGSCPSLLLEPQRTNLITQSEYFDSYVKSDTSILTNQVQSPEGFVNASLVAETATNSNHYLGLTTGVSVVSGTTYTFSVFIKKGDGASAPDYCQLTFNFAGFGAVYANFNLSNGTIGASSGVTPLISDSTINGFWRCSISVTATSTANTGAIVAFTNNNDSLGRLPSYLGNTASDFYAYGFQVEEGSYPTSYIPTYGSSVTRVSESSNSLDVTTDINGQATSWTIFYEFEEDYGVYQNSIRAINDQSDNINVYTHTGGFRFYYRSLSKYITSSSGTKILARYNGSILSEFHDGAEVTYTGSQAGGSSYPFDIYLNPSHIAGVKKILLFPTALTDAECIELTTL